MRGLKNNLWAQIIAILISLSTLGGWHTAHIPPR